MRKATIIVATCNKFHAIAPIFILQITVLTTFKLLIIGLITLAVPACSTHSDRKETSAVIYDDSLTLHPPDSSMQQSGMFSHNALKNRTTEVLTLIKAKDFEELAKWFHPQDGARFSPYGYIDTLKDLRFNRQEFIKAVGSRKPMHWGNYDGSGEAINLTVPEYFTQFVYDADFLDAEHFSVDKLVSSGNSLRNHASIYPLSHFTESYFPGFDKAYDGMDWKSLTLIFKEYGGKIYLVGIVHDQWTI